jgi:hypothetical protein
MWNKLGLYYRTIIDLRPIQIQYRIYYALRIRWRKVSKFKYNLWRRLLKNRSLLLIEPSINTSTKVHNGTFTFLNLGKNFPKEIDWNFSGHGKLWTYNLNYFEFLHQENISKEEGLILISDFIQNIQSAKDGLEPYPISLRVIHWIKFLAQNKIQDQKIDESLFAQLYILLDNLEYHILGNHLLENGFGLFFGAYYFQDEKLYKKATEILKAELKEQILEDGAHFELSPMYHQLMFYRVLDCINLIKNNRIFSQDLLPFFQKKAEKMLGWLQQMTFKNGDIPLLNDSAFSINPTTLELTSYANQLGIFEKIINLKESGYRNFSNQNYEAILDIGKIGPDYIPGHAHCDIFNIVIYVKEQPWIIDTGISTYNATTARHLERSTESHNTVQINGRDQSEIWGSFRVAHKAYVKLEKDTPNSISASHDGYSNLGITHRREFKFSEKTIQIIDSIVAKENTKNLVKAFFHFHPDQKVIVKDQKIITNLGEIEILGANKIHLESYNFAPEFNSQIIAQKVVITFSDQLQISILI